jgi:glycosyltransferase involved in cell wall biosynthesis
MNPRPPSNGGTDEIRTRPSVCLVGTFISHGLPTQGEELASRLKAVCRHVHLLSRLPYRPLRLLHVASHLLLFGGRYDALCIQTYGRRALLLEAVAILCGRARRRRVVLHLHHGGMPANLDRQPQPSRWLYGQADAVVAPSGYLQYEMERHGLRVSIIPNGVEASRYPFRARTRVQPRLLWMRNFYSYYNPLLALRTYELVRRRYPEAALTMAGVDGGMAQEVERAAAAMSLPVQFPGLIPRAQIPAVMDAHDIYLNTNHIDNTPLTVIEALLCGLPVIATAVGGIPYLLRHEQTGLLVGDDDAEGGAAAVARLVETPSLAHHLSRNGRHHAESFAWEHTLPLWAEILTPLSRAAGCPERV